MDNEITRGHLVIADELELEGDERRSYLHLASLPAITDPLPNFSAFYDRLSPEGEDEEKMAGPLIQLSRTMPELAEEMATHYDILRQYPEHLREFLRSANWNYYSRSEDGEYNHSLSPEENFKIFEELNREELRIDVLRHRELKHFTEIKLSLSTGDEDAAALQAIISLCEIVESHPEMILQFIESEVSPAQYQPTMYAHIRSLRQEVDKVQVEISPENGLHLLELSKLLDSLLLWRVPGVESQDAARNTMDHIFASRKRDVSLLDLVAFQLRLKHYNLEWALAAL